MIDNAESLWRIDYLCPQQYNGGTVTSDKDFGKGKLRDREIRVWKLR